VIMLRHEHLAKPPRNIPSGSPTGEAPKLQTGTLHEKIQSSSLPERRRILQLSQALVREPPFAVQAVGHVPALVPPARFEVATGANLVRLFPTPQFRS
jgi:hypothetical protein